ncbi:ABC-three component system middle component 7 [Aeromonas jandaei]|uniref:ABC-three component system middle component 7 n=1 Tax=Aeromonas jandaei TaxID=650 RepID=UPI003EC8ECC9
MIMPNKIIAIDESGIYKAAKLMSKIDGDVAVAELYMKNKKLFSDIPEYIEALDILFSLKRINLDSTNGVIKIA